MSKVVAAQFMSLDGVTEAPEAWHFDYFNDEMGAAVGAGMAAAEAFLLGRRTYEEWAAHWPVQPPDSPTAGVMNAMPKYVASTTLAEVEWEGSTLLEGDVAAAVSELKQRGDGEIMVPGSATLTRSLLADGLVDELRLMVHPVVLGSGGRLFEPGTERVALELVESETFSTGVLNLTYRPAPSEPRGLG
jgi:dihydrofolate reductase